MDKKENSFLLYIVTIPLDIAFIIAADLASFIIRFNGQFPSVPFAAYLRLSCFIIILRMGGFYIFHLYERIKYKSGFESLINITKAISVSSIIIISVLYFMNIEEYPRSIAVLSWLLTIIFISTWRFVIKEFVQVYLGKDFFRSHLLIIGTGRHAEEALIHVIRDAAIEYKFLGYISTSRNAAAKVSEENIIGNIDDMASILKRYDVDEVIVAEPEINKDQLADLTRLLAQNKIHLKSMPLTYECVINELILNECGVSFLGPAILTKPVMWYWSVKRVLDIIFAFIILLITLPLLIFCAILIKAASPGPVFYLQKRTGINGQRFIMFKLRTMSANAEKKGRPVWARRKDARVTPLGSILRFFRIDELPQLINVLKNEMSIIGPRPERPYFVNKLMHKIPFYAERLRVKPGITGWAQVNFKYAATEEDSEQKLLYDIFYIQNMSFALDVLIAFKTLKVILTGRGAQ